MMKTTIPDKQSESKYDKEYCYEKLCVKIKMKTMSSKNSAWKAQKMMTIRFRKIFASKMMKTTNPGKNSESNL